MTNAVFSFQVPDALYLHNSVCFHTQREKWAVFVPSRLRTNLQFYACPKGYCRCRHDSSVGNNTCVYSYSHNDPDLQCTCDRKGTAP